MIDSSKNKSLFSKIWDLPNANKLELLYFPYAFFVFLYSSKDGGYLGFTVRNWIVVFILYVPITFLGLAFLVRKIGISDYRFKLLIHQWILIFIMTLIAILSMGTGIFSIGFDTKFDDLIDIIFDALGFFIPSLIILAAALLSIFNLTNPYQREFENVSSEAAKGNLKAQITNPQILSDGVFGSAANLINEIIINTAELVDRVTESTELMLASSNDLNSLSTEVSTTSMEIGATSRAMSKSASEQSIMINDLTDEINQMSETIVNITKQIKDNAAAVSQIALQTNILALNAGIEASRAGDYGRGFAVVAENVRKLSDESKLSVDKITEVSTFVSEVFQKSFAKINHKIIDVAAISDQTSASAEELAAGTEEMAASLDYLEKMAATLGIQAEKSSKVMHRIKVK